MNTSLRIRLTVCCAWVLILAGCSHSTSPVVPAGPLRTYRMGFSGIPPRADLDILVRSIQLWSQRADAAIISYEVPWDSLLTGVPAESIVVRELVGLANFYRGKGHEIWVYIDPANGLNRAGEADALVRRGRSITEPAIQQIFRKYAVAVDTILHPAHLGLALETNLIRLASSPALYGAIRQAVNGAAADVRSADPTVPLGVSVQVDAAWGRVTGGGYVGVDTDFVDFPFIQELGLSSYPYLAGFADPDSLPSNYYSRLLEGRSVPAAVTEGGWTSASLGGIVSSPEIQRRYIVRQMALLESVNAVAVFQLTFTDLDLSGVVLPPGSILPLFARLGLVDSDLHPKPALSAWDAAFRRGRSGFR